MPYTDQSGQWVHLPNNQDPNRVSYGDPNAKYHIVLNKSDLPVFRTEAGYQSTTSPDRKYEFRPYKDHHALYSLTSAPPTPIADYFPPGYFPDDPKPRLNLGCFYDFTNRDSLHQFSFESVPPSSNISQTSSTLALHKQEVIQTT